MNTLDILLFSLRLESVKHLSWDIKQSKTPACAVMRTIVIGATEQSHLLFSALEKMQTKFSFQKGVCSWFLLQETVYWYNCRQRGCETTDRKGEQTEQIDKENGLASSFADGLHY